MDQFLKKLSFGSHDPCDVRCRGEQIKQIYFIRRISGFRTSSVQVVQVLPYQFEPEPGLQTSNSGDESDSEEESAESSDEEIDHVFEAKNAWRLESLSWCKCGHCTLKPKAIESFCCYEKALEYDEYDALLKEAEAQGGKCRQHNEHMQILSQTCCQKRY